MPTFNEIYSTRLQALRRRQILRHLVEYIDREFHPNSGEQPKMTMLLEEDRTAIPVDCFEELVQEIFLPLVQEYEEEIARIDAANFQPVQPPPTPAEPPGVTPPAAGPPGEST